MLTLPVPIIINSFAGYYKNRMIRSVVAIKHRKYQEERRKRKSYSIPNGIKNRYDAACKAETSFCEIRSSSTVPIGLSRQKNWL